MSKSEPAREPAGMAASAHLSTMPDAASTEIDAAWDTLGDLRQAELDAGTVMAVALEDALAGLTARFPG